MDADNRKKADNAADPTGAKLDGEWTKEQPGKDRPFDFDAFLGQKSLEDQVTEALDGHDQPDEGAGSRYPSGNVPRRTGADGRGRHEAPGPDPEPASDPEPEYPGDPPTQRFTRDGELVPPRQTQQSWQSQPARPSQQQPRQTQQPRQAQQPRPQRPANEPPPRPKVVVAEPAPRVVVTPERQYGGAEPPQKGMGKGVKFLIALLITLGVVLALAVLAVTLLPGGSRDPDAPVPSPTDYLFGGLAPITPSAPTAPPPPTQAPATSTPIPTPVPVTYYTVSVTAGPGGSVSPNGMVDVQEGGSVTFTITPDLGYSLGQLLIDGVNVSVTDTYTFTDVRQGHTLYAIFQQAPATQPPATDVPPVTDAPAVPEQPTEPEQPDLPPAVEG